MKRRTCGSDTYLFRIQVILIKLAGSFCNINGLRRCNRMLRSSLLGSFDDTLSPLSASYSTDMLHGIPDLMGFESANSAYWAKYISRVLYSSSAKAPETITSGCFSTQSVK